jgi:hypothetical protein
MMDLLVNTLDSVVLLQEKRARRKEKLGSSLVTWLPLDWVCRDSLVLVSLAGVTRQGYSQDCTHSHWQPRVRILLLLGSFHCPLPGTMHWHRRELLLAAMVSSEATFLLPGYFQHQRTNLYQLLKKKQS